MARLCQENPDLAIAIWIDTENIEPALPPILIAKDGKL
jgi:hypothetical protein